MKQCDYALYSGTDALALPGIGPALVRELDKKLDAHKQAGHAVPSPPLDHPSQKAAEGTHKPKATSKTKEYSPGLRSGPYAILIALYKALGNDAVGSTWTSKKDIIRLGSPHCDTSFIEKPVTGGNYTAWSSMGTLTRKNLVAKVGGLTLGMMLYMLVLLLFFIIIV